MKITKITRDDEEPIGCNTCTEDDEAFNHVEIELRKGFCVNVWLCDDCLKKLKHGRQKRS